MRVWSRLVVEVSVLVLVEVSVLVLVEVSVLVLVEVSVLVFVELGVLQCCVETVRVESRLVIEVSVTVRVQRCVETVRVESRLLVEVSVLLLEFSVVWKQCMWSRETSCRGSVNRALGVMELCVRQAIVTTALCTGMNWCDGALCEEAIVTTALVTGMKLKAVKHSLVYRHELV